MKSALTCDLDLQISDSVTSLLSSIPEESTIVQWIRTALLSQNKKELTEAEISIRIVDEKESAQFNMEYRQKDSPTNVLSFPADIPTFINSSLLGDLLICANIVEKEAKQQEKTQQAHWAHIIIHGVLHLLSYDHIEKKDAEEMEMLEIDILKNFGFSNPYLTH